MILSQYTVLRMKAYLVPSMVGSLHKICFQREKANREHLLNQRLEDLITEVTV
jgi:hypothetical protein